MPKFQLLRDLLVRDRVIDECQRPYLSSTGPPPRASGTAGSSEADYGARPHGLRRGCTLAAKAPTAD